MYCNTSYSRIRKICAERKRNGNKNKLCSFREYLKKMNSKNSHMFAHCEPLTYDMIEIYEFNIVMAFTSNDIHCNQISLNK